MLPSSRRRLSASKQNEPDLIALLRARFRSYRAAKRTQGIFIRLTIALRVASVLLARDYPKLKPYLALAALVALLLDVGFIDRFQKDLIKRGAKLQEEFDIKVLGMPRNRFVAGATVDHEDVRAASATKLSKKKEKEFASWYEPSVGEVPQHVGRLICQRTNIS